MLVLFFACAMLTTDFMHAVPLITILSRYDTSPILVKAAHENLTKTPTTFFFGYGMAFN
jgi:hypothetical protein